MNLGLKGKTVVITGGSSGIGREAARQFLREGCSVAVCARSRQRLEALAEECRGLPLMVRSVDVTDARALDAFGQEALETFGRVDVWINNAGLSDPMPFEQTDSAAFDRMIAVNLKAVFFGSQTAARLLRATGDKKPCGGGVILNTSSFTSVIPTAGKALYGATKAAVSSLTRTLAAELAADGIRVVGIIPGYIRTGMTEQNISRNGAWLVSNITAGRLGTPEDMAGAYVFLASDAAGYITGTELEVSGGKLCVQNPMWSHERRDKT
ncbi:MAG: SDR family NAD(P)-dependent oxidoreductase [Aristaeellaceae bacterium]